LRSGGMKEEDRTRLLQTRRGDVKRSPLGRIQ
jgi:hypothetical protein